MFILTICNGKGITDFIVDKAKNIKIQIYEK